MKININKFQKDLKIKFKNKPLLIKALTHKSANQKSNNEKLEFLGDRVIGLVLSLSIGIHNYIITGNSKKKINKGDEKIISDCCEALIAAIYIDQDFNYVRNFILKVWKKNINKSTITILDSKTKLQEYSLKRYKKLPQYRLVSTQGPRHNPIYKISVSITASKQFIGVGNSKQQAEQDGATKLLHNKNIN